MRVVGFVALLLVWFGAARLLVVLPLGVLPDPVAGLALPLWLLSPFLLPGGYYHLRAGGTAGSLSADP